MSETINTKIDSYYTTNAKAQRPLNPVAKAPETLPSFHLYSDRDANNKIRAINQDIYVERKKEDKKPLISFIKALGVGVIAVLAFLGIKKLFK